MDPHSFNETIKASNDTVSNSKLHRLLQVNESTSGNETESGSKFMNINKDNLVSDLLLASLALVALLIVLCTILLCLKYAHLKLPQILKKLFRKIKAKLMWSSVLRYMTQSYLDQSIMCMMSLSEYSDLNTASKVISPITLVYLMIIPGFLAFVLY